MKFKDIQTVAHVNEVQDNQTIKYFLNNAPNTIFDV